MHIVDFLFPRTCIGCGLAGQYLCRKCKKSLQPHPEICPVSHRFSPDFAVHIDYRKEVAYEGIAIGFVYEDLVKKLILQIKYYHRYDLIHFLAARLLFVIQTNHTIQRSMRSRKTIVTFIPSHRYRKYFVKGYNQSELLAKHLAEILGCDCYALVYKKKHTRIQAFLSRKKRMKNLEGVFAVKNETTLEGNECIIVVDDVITTGSTINAAVAPLKSRYPGVIVRGVVLGRHL